MGSNERIVYGNRHGEYYQDITDTEDVTEHLHYPNAIRVTADPIGESVQVGVICFDQGTGKPLVTEEDGEIALYAQVDRKALNRLIRDLRDLRDRTFGVDE